ncbi:MAG: phosphoribosylformylglycinamidine cyclo-ligase, partial [Muribaculaceae bacterium]|nr:phosphoribosylformylglycinamidine cyclo-ligase [Muribaculaceae bacterium]
YDAATPAELVYSGGKRLEDSVEGSPLNAGLLVLSPTRTYAPVVKAVLDKMRPQIHGMVHCSGGAQTKVMHFVKDKHVIKDNLFPIPPLFATIREQSGTDWQEMYKVFNMGHRMEIYLAPEHAREVIDIAAGFGIEARVVGCVEDADTNRLTIITENGTFEY